MERFRPELQAVALILGVALVAAFGAVLVSANPNPTVAAPPTPAPVSRAERPAPLPSVVPGPLDGLPTPRRVAQRRTLAVVIDNFYPSARPPAGISGASVVFDALTEGGITRLLALFLEHDPPRFGPIRSARPYFVSWAAGFRAAFVHAGGAPSALQLLRHTPNLVDVEALLPHAAFTRLNGRPAPHNLYGDAARTRATLEAAGRLSSLPAPAFVFHRAVPFAARGAASSFSVSFSTPQVLSPPAYVVTYRYRPGRNVYLRSEGGVPYVDATTGTQVAARNVIILYSRARLIPNDPLGRISLGAVGAGRAVLFQNGHTVKGTWTKASSSAPLMLARSNGQPMALVPGNTWIEITPPGDLSLARGS